MGGGRNEDEIPNNDEQAFIHASHSKSRDHILSQASSNNSAET